MTDLHLLLSKVGVEEKEEVDMYDEKTVFLVKEDISDEQRSRLAECGVRVTNWGADYLVDSGSDGGTV